MKRHLYLLVVAVLLVAAVGNASAVTTSSMEGTWSNAVDGLFVNYPSDVAIGYGNGLEDQVRWGTNIGNGQSGLGFTGSAPPEMAITLGTPFELGQLQHFNNTVGLESACSAVDLTVSMLFSDPAGLSGDFTFTLNINETINTTNPPDDFIYFPDVQPSRSITVDDTLWTLQILGFGPDSDHLTDQFQSPEGSTNATLLWAQITARPVIPAPSAILLGGMGTVLVGWVRRRRAV